MTNNTQVDANTFYSDSLLLLNESGVQYLLGGGFAFSYYTGIYRDTKDLDIFCRNSSYPKILKFFGDKGFRTELTDARWIAKIFKDEYYIDLIFDTPNGICTVDDSWFANSVTGKFQNLDVAMVPPEELIWCKIYVQNRGRFDGADINHLILKQGKGLDWKRLLFRMDAHWQLLLSQLLNFQFVYPSEYRSIIPSWLFDELLNRVQDQSLLPTSVERICRGPIIDQVQYQTDIVEWKYKVITMKTI